MGPHRVTLQEVASHAGVSRTTASFVLTGREDMRIAEETRQRVLRAASELEYRPNLMARSLRTNVTSTIALLSDTIATEQYAGQVIAGCLAGALSKQHLLLIGETERDLHLEKRLIGDFLDRQVDGFIYASMYTRDVEVPPSLEGHPVVLLNCVANGRKLPSVVPDELGAGRSAATALLAAGHRENVYIVGTSARHVIAGRHRRTGITQVLKSAGVRLAGTIECEWWPEQAFDAVTEFLARGVAPSGLICMNDRVAFGTYQALQEAGVAIPDETSVVSFDDSELATWLRPQLTSIALPHYELGRRAVELLLAKKQTTKIEMVPMPLRMRSSIAPPARAGRPRPRAVTALARSKAVSDPVT